MKILLILMAVLGAMNVQAQPKCLFGNELSDLDTNERLLVRKNLIETLKISRQAESDRLVAVRIDVVTDLTTGKFFHVNRTFLDRDDGGNTTGWIEEITQAFRDTGHGDIDRAVVAEIGDSEIYNCKVFF